MRDARPGWARLCRASAPRRPWRVPALRLPGTLQGVPRAQAWVTRMPAPRGPAWEAGPSVQGLWGQGRLDSRISELVWGRACPASALTFFLDLLPL